MGYFSSYDLDRTVGDWQQDLELDRRDRLMSVGIEVRRFVDADPYPHTMFGVYVDGALVDADENEGEAYRVAELEMRDILADQAE